MAISHRVVMLDATAQGIIAVGSARELGEYSTDPRVTAFFGRTPLAQEAVHHVS
jgi:phospholipid/cholesterol/gamma-HCH transport system ATP-binding protein